MNKSWAGSAGVTVALAMVLGASPAGAVNEYVGLTYAKAQERAKGGAVIASRVGSYLPTEECVVTGSRNTSFLDASGNGRGRIVLVDLNCNDPMTAGHPGYSAMTPEGHKAQELRDWGRKISDNFAKATDAGVDTWCSLNLEKCQSACEQSGTCSAEVLEFLGM